MIELLWWPKGVRKSHDAPMATAIRKASGETPSSWAILITMGAMITTVAALFSTGVTTMVAISTTASMPTGPAVGAIMTTAAPIQLASPVVWTAVPSGIMV